MDRDSGSLVKRDWRNKKLKEPGGVGWREKYKMLLRKTKSQGCQQFGKRRLTVTVLL